MEELVAPLAARLPPGAVRLKARVTGRGARGRRAGASTTADGDALAADARDPRRRGARRPRGSCATSIPRSRTLLEEIPYASSATVTLAYRRADVRHPLDGFGFVVPHAEGAAHHRGHVLEREVSGPRARGPRAAARASSAARSTRGDPGRRTTSALVATRARELRDAARRRRRAAAAPASRATRTRCRSTTSATSRAWRRSSGAGPPSRASRSPAAPTAASASPTASAPARPRREGCSSAEASTTRATAPVARQVDVEHRVEVPEAGMAW